MLNARPKPIAFGYLALRIFHILFRHSDLAVDLDGSHSASFHKAS
jgi:hypothetical protein